MSEGSLDRVARAAARHDASRVARGRRVVDRAAKRTVDFVLAAILLVLASPIILICSVAVKLDSRGPVFYRAQRVGRRGRRLQVLKFRKMPDRVEGHALTLDGDPRFTRVGRVLARTKFDELPQLWNVLVGDMSLVGPRPEDPGFVDIHKDEYTAILTVRPGITGLCQLAFAKEGEILDREDRTRHYVETILPQKVKLDVFYARTRTFVGDLRILLWTVLPVLLRVDVAVNRTTGRLTVRRRSRSSSGRP